MKFRPYKAQIRVTPRDGEPYMDSVVYWSHYQRGNQNMVDASKEYVQKIGEAPKNIQIIWSAPLTYEEWFEELKKAENVVF